MRRFSMLSLVAAVAFVAFGTAVRASGQDNQVVPPDQKQLQEFQAHQEAQIDGLVKDLNLSKKKADQVKSVLREEATARRNERVALRSRVQTAGRQGVVAREVGRDRRELRNDRRELRRDRMKMRRDRRFNRTHRRAYQRGWHAGHRDARRMQYNRQLDEKLGKILSKEEMDRFHELHRERLAPRPRVDADSSRTTAPRQGRQPSGVK